MYSSGYGGTTGLGGYGQPAQQQHTDQFDFEISHQFTDSISCLKYAPINPVYQSTGFPLLAVASWDGNVAIYQVSDQGNQIQANCALSTSTGAPVLGLCWQPEVQALLIASADNNIKRWDLASNQVTVVGQHSQPVKDIYCCQIGGNPLVISGGWDARVKFWTWAPGPPLKLNQVGEAYLGKPVHYMSGEFPLLVTAHSELYVHYWDLNRITQNDFNPLGVMNSPLKYPTTTIACFADGKGYAIGSIEGRCGIKYIDLQKNIINPPEDFCFKSHRVDDTSTPPKPSQVHAVNGIAFNKQFGTFVTYGQDGSWFIWNKDTKSKLKNTKAGPHPITAADFLDNATQLAYAFGYDWGKGAEESKK